ncbi:MAG: hypothetical protein ACOX6A_04330 [Atribacter sp.]
MTLIYVNLNLSQDGMIFEGRVCRRGIRPCCDGFGRRWSRF